MTPSVIFIVTAQNDLHTTSWETERHPSIFCQPVKHCDSGLFGITNGYDSIIQHESDENNCQCLRCIVSFHKERSAM